MWRRLTPLLVVVAIIAGLLVALLYVVPTITRGDADCYQSKQPNARQPISLECTAGMAGRGIETRTQETRLSAVPDPARGEWVATFSSRGDVVVKADARPAPDGTLLVVVRTPASWGDLVGLTHR